MRRSSIGLNNSTEIRKIKIIRIVILILVCLTVIGMACFVVKTINENASTAIGNTQTENQKDGTIEEKTSLTAEQEEKIITIINADNQISVSYPLDLVDYGDIKCDAMIKEPLKKMLNAAKKAGYSLKVIQGYINKSDQQKMFNKYVDKYTGEGLSSVRAEMKASEVEPIGGCSVMQTGLAVDISTNDSISDSDFEKTEEYVWLVNNCINYGFIQRYPRYKTQKTACAFHAKRFRYVGVEIAQQMRRLNMCFEEYVEYINSRE